MTQRILELFSGQIVTTRDIAIALGKSSYLTRSALSGMQKRGYVRLVSPGIRGGAAVPATWKVGSDKQIH